MEPIWTELFNSCGLMCDHEIQTGSCFRQRLLGTEYSLLRDLGFPEKCDRTRYCDSGMRLRNIYVLCASLLGHFRAIDQSLRSASDIRPLGYWHEERTRAEDSKYEGIIQMVRLRVPCDAALPPATVAVSSEPRSVDELVGMVHNH